MTLLVTLEDFQVQCEGYTLHLSYRLNGRTVRVPLRDLAESHIYATHVLAERLGAYRQADAFDKGIETFYVGGVCPLTWRPDVEEAR